MSEYTERPIRVGSVFKYDFIFSQSDVISFAKASGDENPIHLDENYAKKTIFKKRILHGFLGGSVFSKVFGTLFPGEGTIYLRQDMTFLKPMFISTNYIANFKILSVRGDKNRATVSTIIKDDNGVMIISGEALIQHPNIGV